MSCIIELTELYAVCAFEFDWACKVRDPRLMVDMVGWVLSRMRRVFHRKNSGPYKFLARGAARSCRQSFGRGFEVIGERVRDSHEKSCRSTELSGTRGLHTCLQLWFWCFNGNQMTARDLLPHLNFGVVPDMVM